MIYQQTILQFSKMLKNLSAILDKASLYADDKKFDIGVLLEFRLAPDQFNFIRQVQITCDTAKSAAASWANRDAPVFSDVEKTLPELKNRIDSTINYLKTFSNADFVDASTRKISRPRWEGKHLLGEEFLIEHVLPNFYFHLTTAYSILRHNGIPVGKRDYLGEIKYRN